MGRKPFGLPRDAWEPESALELPRVLPPPILRPPPPNLTDAITDRGTPFIVRLGLGLGVTGKLLEEIKIPLAAIAIAPDSEQDIVSVESPTLGAPVPLALDQYMGPRPLYPWSGLPGIIVSVGSPWWGWLEPPIVLRSIRSVNEYDASGSNGAGAYVSRLSVLCYPKEVPFYALPTMRAPLMIERRGLQGTEKTVLPIYGRRRVTFAVRNNDVTTRSVNAGGVILGQTPGQDYQSQNVGAISLAANAENMFDMLKFFGATTAGSPGPMLHFMWAQLTAAVGSGYDCAIEAQDLEY